MDTKTTSFFNQNDYKEIYSNFAIEKTRQSMGNEEKARKSESTLPPIEQRPESPATMSRRKA